MLLIYQNNLYTNLLLGNNDNIVQYHLMIFMELFII
jgi:hypothetical protein